MSEWWKRSSSQEAVNPARRAVAYYRHSAQDRQENSIPIQRDQVREWALQNGIEIIQEFSDAGKSGLSTEHRDAFVDMFENWIKVRKDFKYILILDVSRFGRFQDTDLSAVYSQTCTQHGKQVVYVTMGIPKEGDPLYTIYLQFERYRAAEYSRELSKKVFNGCKKISEQGYRSGGMPPYATHRLLLNEKRDPVRVLEPGERKSIQNQRVTLTPGDQEHTKIVQRIFRDFVERKWDEQQIADSLNIDSIPSPGGSDWHLSTVRKILQNEIYIGTMVYNRTTQRLQSKTKRNPRSEWVLTADAFDPVVSKELFESAQAIFAERARRETKEYMIERLRFLYHEYGVIREKLIRSDSESPNVGHYRRVFGSLDEAYKNLYSDVLKRVETEVVEQLGRHAKDIESYENIIILNREVSIRIEPSIPIPNGYGAYWSFRQEKRSQVDITLGVPLSNNGEYDILGYLVFPRLLERRTCVRVSSASDTALELHGFGGLDMISTLLS